MISLLLSGLGDGKAVGQPRQQADGQGASNFAALLGLGTQVGNTQVGVSLAMPLALGAAPDQSPSSAFPALTEGVLSLSLKPGTNPEGVTEAELPLDPTDQVKLAPQLPVQTDAQEMLSDKTVRPVIGANAAVSGTAGDMPIGDLSGDDGAQLIDAVVTSQSAISAGTDPQIGMGSTSASADGQPTFDADAVGPAVVAWTSSETTLGLARLQDTGLPPLTRQVGTPSASAPVPQSSGVSVEMPQVISIGAPSSNSMGVNTPSLSAPTAGSVQTATLNSTVTAPQVEPLAPLAKTSPVTAVTVPPALVVEMPEGKQAFTQPPVVEPPKAGNAIQVAALQNDLSQASSTSAPVPLEQAKSLRSDTPSPAVAVPQAKAESTPLTLNVARPLDPNLNGSQPKSITPAPELAPDRILPKELQTATTISRSSAQPLFASDPSLETTGNSKPAGSMTPTAPVVPSQPDAASELPGERLANSIAVKETSNPQIQMAAPKQSTMVSSERSLSTPSAASDGTVVRPVTMRESILPTLQPVANTQPLPSTEMPSIPVAATASADSAPMQMPAAVPDQPAGKPAPKPFADSLLSQVRAVSVEEGRTTVQLHPRGLGTIEVEMRIESDLASKVIVRVENPAVLNTLREERQLLAQTIGVADSSVIAFEDGPTSERQAGSDQHQEDNATSAFQSDADDITAPEHQNVLAGGALDVLT